MKNRKSNRLKNFDYSQNGMYFVTICVKNREELFGEIKNGKMTLSKIGMIAQKCLLEIPDHFPHIFLDEFVVMPNHIHGILEIINPDPVGGKNFCPLQAPRGMPWQTKWSRSLSSAVRGFKIGLTKWCNENDCYFSWQRNYYDRVIRSDCELQKIREYIQNNPINWEHDRSNLENVFI